jgi:PAS domain S-box-containing protein
MIYDGKSKDGPVNDLNELRNLINRLKAEKLAAEQALQEREETLRAFRATLDLRFREKAIAQKRSEDLEEKTRLIQILLDAFPCVALLIRPSTMEIVACNKTAERMGAVAGGKCFSVWGRCERPCPWCKAPATWSTGEAQHVEFEEMGIVWDSHWIPVGPNLYMHYAFDITERKRVEESLRKSEAKYRAIFDNAGMGIALLDSRGRIQEASNALTKMLGYTEDELRNLTIFDLVHPEDVKVSCRRIQALIRGERDAYRTEKRYIRKDGSPFWADVCVSAIHDDAGGHEALIAVFNDITSRKESELALKRLATAVEQAAEAIIVTDTRGNIEYVNPACEEISGYTREETVGSHARIFKSDYHGPWFYQELWKTINNGTVWRGRFVNRKKDGSLYHEDTTISPVRDARGVIVNFVAVKRDVTEHLALSKQLVHAQKMEAIGTLAGGIAHDFNNLLQITMGYSEMLLMQKDKSDPDYEDLQRIMQSARNGAELVRSLLAFSRRLEPNPIPLDLNAQIRHVEALLLRTIPKMIEIRLDLGQGIGEILADPTQIEQIIMNMAVNSRDAMPDGGALTISTRRVILGRDECKARAEAHPGEHVVLTISDTGHGMDKETLTHIFEPFFTTKEAGRGTGLGLAMVYGIVKQHGGHIICESEPGRGSSFHVFLPAQEAVSRHTEASVDEHPVAGTETILLVDDEESVRELGKRILTRAGYTVLTAANGAEGVEVYRSSAESVSLVILDLLMPKMGGAQCLEKLLRINPQVRVLVTSGYLTDDPAHKHLVDAAAGFVSKPFQIKEILRLVREALDGDDSKGKRKTR